MSLYRPTLGEQWWLNRIANGGVPDHWGPPAGRDQSDPRFCVRGPDGIIHEMRADDATDQGLDAERVYCPEHDGGAEGGEPR